LLKKQFLTTCPIGSSPGTYITNSGNPTHSILVNDLIKKIKKMEVRKEGVTSKARRSMELGEFCELIKRLRSSELPLRKFNLSAYFIFQYNMIGRVDDIEKNMWSELSPCVDFDFILKACMCWSKNVQEERDAPEQVIFGAMDPAFCAQLALAIHIEHAIMTGSLHDGVDAKSGGMFCVSKKVASNHLKMILEAPDFPNEKLGPVGSHSICKSPATYARRKGCSRDDIDCRGRWKTKKRIVDTYIDVNLPYPDAKVASVLCIGGAIKYELREGSGVSDD